MASGNIVIHRNKNPSIQNFYFTDERTATEKLCFVYWEADCAGSRIEDLKMHISAESLIIILMIGLIAGWLAGQIVQGTGFGLVGDMVMGVVGAFIGSWLLPQLGIQLGAGIVAAIVNATLGALVLLFLIRLVRGGGWHGSWRGR